jgi:hypothetical protein
MKRLLLLSAVVIGIAAFAASVSWRRASADTTATGADAPDEPITGSPSVPNPGSETVRHDPFTPYDNGGSAAAWSYDQLTTGEKSAADAAAHGPNWAAIHNAFGDAVAERSQGAAAAAAANQLNLSDLSTQGVIP